jgi:hypothetical protein
MEQTECSETSAFTTQMPGNYPKETTQHSKHGESLKSRINLVHSKHTYLPMKMEQTERFETSAFKIQTPGNYPKEIVQHSKDGESLKSRNQLMLYREIMALFSEICTKHINVLCVAKRRIYTVTSGATLLTTGP